MHDNVFKCMYDNFFNAVITYYDVKVTLFIASLTAIKLVLL